MIRGIGVFCGSSSRVDGVHRSAAAELGTAIAARGMCLVYGGGRIGLLMLSPLARAGHATDAFYDHNSLLRTTEDAFGVGEHLNNAGSSKVHPMSDLFRR